MSRAADFWKNKTVIVTGASSGIGEALVRHVAANGSRVGLIARREKLLQQIAADIRSSAGIAAVAVADVTNTASVAAAVRELEETLGPSDVCVANAGIYRKTSGLAYNATVANLVFSTNVIGVNNLFGAVLPGMLERRHGHLAAIASLAAFVGLPAGNAYSASKAAVVRMLDSLRVDLSGTGVHVTTICPGFVATPMITDEERATMKGILSAPAAAQRIADAIRRKKEVDAFPWLTYIGTRLAHLLPPGLYCRVMKMVGEMEDTHT